MARSQDALTQVLVLLVELLLDLGAEFTLGDLDIVLGVTVILHEGEVVIVGNVELGNEQLVRLPGRGEAG